MYNSFFSHSSTSIPSNPLYLQALRSHLLPLSFRTIRYTPYSFYDTAANTFDVLIVDEAHRLNHKSGLFQNKGENQIREIIDAAKFTVFFVDDNQKVHIKDVGDSQYIEKIALNRHANVKKLELSSQFRCNGSDGYLAWLDNTLQITDTANIRLSRNDFDFRIFSDPSELRRVIEKKTKSITNPAW